ncbi:MAG: histidine phosphatase family protein [Pseudolysinimonas sp.]
MRILFIRHGQTQSNVDGALDTATPGPGLTTLGTRQAEAVPAALGQAGITAIYVSQLLRTHETAAPLAAALGLTPIELPGLHEIEAGSLEGLSDIESVRGYMGTVFAWGEGHLDRAMPGGLDGTAFFARFDADVAHIVASHAADDTVVVVSHGAAIRVWTGSRVANLGEGFTGENRLDNTAVVVVDGSPESGWTALSWGGVPIGGAALNDPQAEDVIGETVDEPSTETSTES